MHVVIMGCGRVGSTLAHTLVDLGHTVAVIDQDPEAFRRLRGSVAKHAVRGMGHDRAVLLSAGIDRAGAFAAVSNGDNSNIIAARVAREAFGVEHVVARIYDPRRAEVYGLLASVRSQLNQLWEEVEAHNRAHPIPEGEGEKVCFYFGQSCCDPEDSR